MRTSEDFVNEMLAHGRDWIAIMAVARFVRNGNWYDNIKVILQTKGLMPTDEPMIIKLKEEAIKNRKPVSEESRYKVLSMTPKQTQSKPSGLTS